MREIKSKEGIGEGWEGGDFVYFGTLLKYYPHDHKIKI
jgi:hypothetical protein